MSPICPEWLSPISQEEPRARSVANMSSPRIDHIRWQVHDLRTKPFNQRQKCRSLRSRIRDTPSTSPANVLKQIANVQSLCGLEIAPLTMNARDGGGPFPTPYRRTGPVLIYAAKGGREGKTNPFLCGKTPPVSPRSPPESSRPPQPDAFRPSSSSSSSAYT